MRGLVITPLPPGKQSSTQKDNVLRLGPDDMGTCLAAQTTCLSAPHGPSAAQPQPSYQCIARRDGGPENRRWMINWMNGVRRVFRSSSTAWIDLSFCQAPPT